MTDEPGLLSAAARDRVESCLRGLEARSGRQVLVYIGASLGDRSLEDFAVRAFKDWRVGRADKDDGLVLFVFPAERRIRIEVGYGLEGDVPDAAASGVINDVMAPQLRAGDPDAAIEGAVASLLVLLGEPPCTELRAAARVEMSNELTTAQKIVLAVILALLLLFFITNPRAALWLLVQLATSGRGGRGWQRVGGGGGSWGGGGGGGSWGGGGFSGGGGSSGGGGASGGW